MKVYKIRQFIYGRFDLIFTTSLLFYNALYFIVITNIVIFGALTDKATNGAIGTIESIVASSMCGTLFALLAGQPLAILCQIGPMLLFDKILYGLCQQHGFDFLSFRLQTGLCAILILYLIDRF